MDDAAHDDPDLMRRAEDDPALDVALVTRRAIDSRPRLRILLRLSRGACAVGALGEELAMSQPLVSYHLRRLLDAGLVRLDVDSADHHAALRPAAHRPGPGASGRRAGYPLAGGGEGRPPQTAVPRMSCSARSTRWLGRVSCGSGRQRGSPHPLPIFLIPLISL
jgi:DNA-binding transcriptional ArsR family regulator